MDRLDTFLAATDTGRPEDVALRTLTLHMLEHVAPRLFEARDLGPQLIDALKRCARVDYGLGHALEPDRLMAGVDAWYCRHLRYLPHAPPDPFALRTALQWLADDGQLIYAWLIGELAHRCGLDARVPVDGKRPFIRVSRTHDVYFLTHLVMLDSDYFSKPVTHEDAKDWGDALLEAVPWLQRKPNDDLAGEVVLCLHFLERLTPEAKALVANPAPTDDAHAQATVLLALSAE